MNEHSPKVPKCETSPDAKSHLLHDVSVDQYVLMKFLRNGRSRESVTELNPEALTKLIPTFEKPSPKNDGADGEARRIEMD